MTEIYLTDEVIWDGYVKCPECRHVAGLVLDHFPEVHPIDTPVFISAPPTYPIKQAVWDVWRCPNPFRHVDKELTGIMPHALSEQRNMYENVRYIRAIAVFQGFKAFNCPPTTWLFEDLPTFSLYASYIETEAPGIQRLNGYDIPFIEKHSVIRKLLHEVGLISEAYPRNVRGRRNLQATTVIGDLPENVLRGIVRNNAPATIQSSVWEFPQGKERAEEGPSGETCNVHRLNFPYTVELL